MSQARAAILSLILASTFAFTFPTSIAEEGGIGVVEGHVEGHPHSRELTSIDLLDTVEIIRLRSTVREFTNM